MTGPIGGVGGSSGAGASGRINPAAVSEAIFKAFDAEPGFHRQSGFFQPQKGTLRLSPNANDTLIRFEFTAHKGIGGFAGNIDMGAHKITGTYDFNQVTFDEPQKLGEPAAQKPDQWCGTPLPGRRS